MHANQLPAGRQLLVPLHEAGGGGEALDAHEARDIDRGAVGGGLQCA